MTTFCGYILCSERVLTLWHDDVSTSDILKCFSSVHLFSTYVWKVSSQEDSNIPGLQGPARHTLHCWVYCGNLASEVMNENCSWFGLDLSIVWFHCNLTEVPCYCVWMTKTKWLEDHHSSLQTAALMPNSVWNLTEIWHSCLKELQCHSKLVTPTTRSIISATRATFFSNLTTSVSTSSRNEVQHPANSFHSFSGGQTCSHASGGWVVNQPTDRLTNPPTNRPTYHTDQRVNPRLGCWCFSPLYTVHTVFSKSSGYRVSKRAKNELCQEDCWKQRCLRTTTFFHLCHLASSGV